MDEILEARATLMNSNELHRPVQLRERLTRQLHEAGVDDGEVTESLAQLLDQSTVALAGPEWVSASNAALHTIDARLLSPIDERDDIFSGGLLGETNALMGLVMVAPVSADGMSRAGSFGDDFRENIDSFNGSSADLNGVKVSDGPYSQRHAHTTKTRAQSMPLASSSVQLHLGQHEDRVFVTTSAEDMPTGAISGDAVPCWRGAKRVLVRSATMSAKDMKGWRMGMHAQLGDSTPLVDPIIEDAPPVQKTGRQRRMSLPHAPVVTQEMAKMLGLEGMMILVPQADGLYDEDGPSHAHPWQSAPYNVVSAAASRQSDVGVPPVRRRQSDMGCVSRDPVGRSSPPPPPPPANHRHLSPTTPSVRASFVDARAAPAAPAAPAMADDAATKYVTWASRGAPANAGDFATKRVSSASRAAPATSAPAVNSAASLLSAAAAPAVISTTMASAMSASAAKAAVTVVDRGNGRALALIKSTDSAQVGNGIQLPAAKALAVVMASNSAQVQVSNLPVSRDSSRLLPELRHRNSSLPDAHANASPHHIPDALNQILAKVDDWGFNTFELQDVTEGHALSVLAFALIKRLSAFKSFAISEARLARYLLTIEAGYEDKNYHSVTHAADVLQSVHALCTRGGVWASIEATEPAQLAMYLAAAVHDYQHRHVTNDFLIKTADELAIRYNDRTPMENHHIAAAWQELMYDRNNFLVRAPLHVVAAVREIMIAMVLSTEMKQHFAFAAMFHTKAESLESLTSLSSSDAARSGPLGSLVAGMSVASLGRSHSFNKSVHASTSTGQLVSHSSVPLPMWDSTTCLLVMKMVLKWADIGHLAAPLAVHKRWIGLLQEEMFQQGDQEEARGLPISPLMDRKSGNGIVKSQTGFFNVVALPMYQDMAAVFVETVPMLTNVHSNFVYWSKCEAVAKAKAAVTAARESVHAAAAGPNA